MLDDLPDVVYPNGIFYINTFNGRRYLKWPKVGYFDGQCYEVHCTEGNGGCGALVTGDSKEEAVEKWNRRVKS